MMEFPWPELRAYNTSQSISKLSSETRIFLHGFHPYLTTVLLKCHLSSGFILEFMVQRSSRDRPDFRKIVFCPSTFVLRSEGKRNNLLMYKININSMLYIYIMRSLTLFQQCLLVSWPTDHKDWKKFWVGLTKKPILLFNRDALNWLKVKTFIMLQNISISNKHCSFYSSNNRENDSLLIIIKKKEQQIILEWFLKYHVTLK